MAEGGDSDSDFDSDYGTKLRELWGRGLDTVRLYVRRGDIEADKIRSLAMNEQVGALDVYDNYRYTQQQPLDVTFERILEHWLNDSLYRYQPQQAQETLLEVLRQARWPNRFIDGVKSKLSFFSTREIPSSG